MDLLLTRASSRDTSPFNLGSGRSMVCTAEEVVLVSVIGVGDLPQLDISNGINNDPITACLNIFSPLPANIFFIAALKPRSNVNSLTILLFKQIVL